MGLIGLYFGGLRLWTGNLLAPIAAHAVYDFLALIYQGSQGREVRVQEVRGSQGQALNVNLQDQHNLTFKA